MIIKSKKQYDQAMKEYDSIIDCHDYGELGKRSVKRQDVLMDAMLKYNWLQSQSRHASYNKRKLR